MPNVFFKDANGNELYEGCKVELTTNERVGERTTTYKRQKNTYGINEDVTVQYIVRLGVFKSIHHGNIYTWYIETAKSITYNTSFYAGCGSTPTEKFANASRPITNNLSRVLSEGLAKKCRISL